MPACHVSMAISAPIHRTAVPKKTEKASASGDGAADATLDRLRLGTSDERKHELPPAVGRRHRAGSATLLTCQAPCEMELGFDDFTASSRSMRNSASIADPQLAHPRVPPFFWHCNGSERLWESLR
jgi:hypothetical protein